MGWKKSQSVMLLPMALRIDIQPQLYEPPKASKVAQSLIGG